MKKYRIPKLIGISILSMICLVLISFLEVFLYSYLIDPGHEHAFYEAHAELTAPWISSIFGCILFFLIVRYWHRKGTQDLLKLAILLPVVYVVLDVVILLLEGSVVWQEFMGTFIAAEGAKVIGSLGAYFLYSKSDSPK